MNTEQTLTDKAKESTQKLLFYDTLIKSYVSLQWSCKVILETMNQQTRIDSDTATLLHETYALTLRKLAALHEAREKHFIKHDRLMAQLLDGEN